MLNNEFLTLSIGIVALIISLISLARTRKNTSKLIELEEIHADLSKRQLEEFESKEIEKNKADLQATLNSDNSKVIIRNTGQGMATNIFSALINNVGKKNPFQASDFNDKNPYISLNSKEQYFLRVSFSMSDSQRIYEFELSWENGDGSHSKKQFVLSR